LISYLLWHRVIEIPDLVCSSEDIVRGWIGELFAYRADGKTQNTETEPEFDSFTKPLVTFTSVKLIDIVG
jgi:hypothetical protein